MSQQQYEAEVLMELQQEQEDFINSINATLRELSSFLAKHNDIFLEQLKHDGDK